MAAAYQFKTIEVAGTVIVPKVPKKPMEDVLIEYIKDGISVNDDDIHRTASHAYRAMIAAKDE